jgi:hypothetical protein
VVSPLAIPTTTVAVPLNVPIQAGISAPGAPPKAQTATTQCNDQCAARDRVIGRWVHRKSRRFRNICLEQCRILFCKPLLRSDWRCGRCPHECERQRYECIREKIPAMGMMYTPGVRGQMGMICTGLWLQRTYVHCASEQQEGDWQHRQATEEVAHESTSGFGAFAPVPVTTCIDQQASTASNKSIIQEEFTSQSKMT